MPTALPLDDHVVLVPVTAVVDQCPSFTLHDAAVPTQAVLCVGERAKVIWPDASTVETGGCWAGGAPLCVALVV
jgi:hypothetical protein